MLRALPGPSGPDPIPSASFRALAALALLGLAPDLAAQEEGEGRVLQSPSGLTVTVREKVLGIGGPDVVENSIRLSPDGEGLAYVSSGGGALTVIRDNVPQESFDGVAALSLRYSPDGRRLAYTAVNDKKHYVVVDDQKYAFAGVSEQGVVFSRHSEHAAWVALSPEKKQLAVVDGKVVGEHDGVAPGGISFSPNGERWVYLATDDGRESLVVDGEAGPYLEDILQYWWSTNGDRIGYIAQDGATKLVFVDGELVAEADELGKDGIRFSRDGSRSFCAVRIGEVWRLLIDGELTGTYYTILPEYSISRDGSTYAMLATLAPDANMSLIINGEPVEGHRNFMAVSFNPETVAPAFIARGGGEMYAVIDGEREPGFEFIDRRGVFFSPDGEHYAYVGRDGQKRYVVHDGKRSDPMARFGRVQPTFLPDGRLIYSAVIRGRTRMVVDGEDQISYDRVGRVSRSIEGGRYGYVGFQGDRRIMVVDGKEVGFHHFLPGPPVFSDDGKRYAYHASRDEKHFVVVDGVEGEAFDYILKGSVAFTPDGRHVAYMSATGAGRYLMLDDLKIENGYTGFSTDRGVKFQDEKHFSVRAAQGDRYVLVTVEIH